MRSLFPGASCNIKRGQTPSEKGSDPFFHSRGRRGTIFITSIGVMVFLTLVGAGFMIRSLGEQHTSQRYARLATAFQTAEAGLDQALVNLEDDPDWSGTTSAIQVTAGGYYEVDVDDDDSGYTKLTVTGHYPTNDSSAWGYQRRQIEAMVDLEIPSVFQCGLCGDERVKIEDGVIIDSYDSSKGNGQYDPANPGENGDVMTNNTEAESIVLEAGAGETITINGQAVVGPDMENPDDAVTIEGDVTISADPDVASQSTAMELPAVTEPANCEGDQVVGDGEVLALDANVKMEYCYTSLKLEGTGAITVTGDVTVYTRDLQLEDDSKVNENGKPTQLLVKITTSNEVKLENNGKFVGAIYAPDSLIKLENDVVLYGSAVGNEIKVENATAIHYDEALSTVGPGNGKPAEAFLISWREL